MISTRHGRDQRVGEARLRPEHRPGREGEHRDRDHRRHEPGRRPGRPAAGSARASAARPRPSARSAPACVSRPTFSARITKLPVVLSVPPITLAPGSLVTGIDSPVTMRLVERRAALDARTPSTGTFSPGRTRSRSPTAIASSATSSSLPSRDAARGLRREIEQRADRARGLLARAQLQHLAEQHQHGDDRGRLEIDRDRAAMAAEARPGTCRARPSRPRCRARRRRCPCAISVNMLRLRVTTRLPAAHEERPAGPQHHRRRERELDPVRQRRDR